MVIKIGRLIMAIIPLDKGLFGVAQRYEDLKKKLDKKYKVSKEDLWELSKICFGFRKVGRKEPHLMNEEY